MDAALLPARVSDTLNLCERTGVPHFLGFLSPSESAVADSTLAHIFSRYSFFGGYDGAERTFLCCRPDWCEEPKFPITAVTFTFRVCDKLSHRDFLGALMGLGIVREAVGDILVEDGRAVVFLADEIVGYVMSQCEKVGNTGVTLSVGFSEPLPQSGQKLLCCDTVASLRLDCVVSAIGGISRNISSEMIDDGLVSLNSVCCKKSTRTVCECDRITVRGKGRFEILSVSELTRKSRIKIQFYKYV